MQKTVKGVLRLKKSDMTVIEEGVILNDNNFYTPVGQYSQLVGKELRPKQEILLPSFEALEDESFDIDHTEIDFHLLEKIAHKQVHDSQAAELSINDNEEIILNKFKKVYIKMNFPEIETRVKKVLAHVKNKMLKNAVLELEKQGIRCELVEAVPAEEEVLEPKIEEEQTA